MATTQTRHPWRATVRTIFQALVGLAAVWAVVVEAAGLDPSWPWVAASLAVTAAITRVMALPGVEQWLQRFLPWLAADPYVGEHREGNGVEGYWESHRPLDVDAEG